MSHETIFGEHLDKVCKQHPQMITTEGELPLQWLTFKALLTCPLDTIDYIRSNYDMDDYYSNDSIMNAIWEKL